ncbi:MAG: type II secretion system protein, partial [Planctomycetes bacterium]|nr:type II secretion system protein [Planctomycetota bacterium]
MPRAHRSGLPRQPRHQRQRAGFTLFETAISLAVIGTAVLSAMLLLPAGLRVHRLARFQLLAAAKAEELVELFLASANVRSNIESEATSPWEVPAAYGSQAMDVEARVASNKAGVIPLPGGLSQRIDSDGDEIAHILAEGGSLYYFHPSAAGGFEEQVWLAAGGGAPTDAQKLVFAVRGAPQQNAISIFPWKAWPYYTGYPSPPTHVLRMHDADMPAGAKLLGWPLPGYAAFCFDGAGPASQPGVDPDLAEVFACTDASGVDHGFEPYAYGSGPSTPTVDGAIRYLQTALWYCARKGLGTAFYA